MQPSPLLQLPPELRNRIYHELFAASPEGVFCLTEISMEPAILTVSRQLRNECSGIFYSNTILHFSDPKVILRRLKSLPEKYVQIIPGLRYDTTETCTRVQSWRTAFRDLPGLEEDTKLEALREELMKARVAIRVGVLKARICVDGTAVWTADPLGAALDGATQGMMVGNM